MTGNTDEPRCVLLVDDNVAVVESFARVLRGSGFDVHTAPDGAGALDELRKTVPDAVLLDLRMALMDGLSFLRKLRTLESHRSTPVAIITGDCFVNKAVGVEVNRLGAELYFKPLWSDDLTQIIHDLLHRTRH